MLVLTLRTDKPEAETGLLDGGQKLVYETWEAHRQLAETIHQKIEALLKSQDKSWHDIQGIVVFKGPGSFTGLRIGLTVANSLAYGLEIPIVGERGGEWVQKGLVSLQNGKNEQQVLPFYGAPVHITQQKR